MVGDPPIGKTIVCVQMVDKVGRQHRQRLLGHGCQLCLPSRTCVAIMEARHRRLPRLNAAALQEALNGPPHGVRVLPELCEPAKRKHILGKLGFRSRAHVAVWAVRPDPAGQAMGHPDERLGSAP